jgi:DNA repair protein RAD5
MNLKSKYSWCLTGTLIQNSEQDLFAIFKFLRVEVFSEEAWWNQYIKNTTCTQAKLNVIQTVLRPIVLRRTKASTSNQGEAIL